MSNKKTISKQFGFGEAQTTSLNKMTKKVLLDIFFDMSQEMAIRIRKELYFLYYFSIFNKKKVNNQIFQVLFEEISIQEINKIVQKFKIFKEPLENVGKLEAIKNFINVANLKCSISSIFLQDIFKPEYIFKKKYSPHSVDTYITSLYYLLQCKYKKNNFPLSIKSEPNKGFFFPFDVDIKEWTRPIFIVDVQNATRFHKFLSIQGRNYETTSFQSRKEIILKERKYILEKLFHKHNLPGAMVFFITQSDTNQKQSCLKITNLKNSETENILEHNRVALFIEVPCSQFVYTINDYFLTDFSTVNDFTGEKNDKTVHKYWFDKNNILYAFDQNDMKYKQVEASQLNKDLTQIQSQQKQKQGVSQKMVKSQKNFTQNNSQQYKSESQGKRSESQGQKYESQGQKLRAQRKRMIKEILLNIKAEDKKQNAKSMIQVDQYKKKFQGQPCKNNKIGNTRTGIKNEQDDQMIGLLLLFIQKTNEECFKLIFRHKPIVFTNDKYEWMNESLKSVCIFEKDFFRYLETEPKKNNSKMNVYNYQFWFNAMKPQNKEQMIEIQQALYKNIT